MISVVIVNFSRALSDNPASKKAIKNIKKSSISTEGSISTGGSISTAVTFISVILFLLYF